MAPLLCTLLSKAGSKGLTEIIWWAEMGAERRAGGRTQLTVRPASFGLSSDQHRSTSNTCLYLEDLIVIYTPRPPEELCRSATWWADCDYGFYLLMVILEINCSNGPEVPHGSWSCADTLKLSITWRTPGNRPTLSMYVKSRVNTGS